MFDQIGQVITGTIAGNGFLAAVAIFHCPINPAVDEKKVYTMSLAVGNFGKLKTASCFLVIVVAQYE